VKRQKQPSDHRNRLTGVRGLFLATSLVASIGITALPATASDVLDNGKFRFGNGAESAVTAKGFLRQASYFSASANNWRILTHPSTQPDLSLAFGYGSGNALANWTQNDARDYIDKLNGPTVSSGPSTTSTVVNGSGTLTVTTGYTLTGGKTIEASHQVTLEPGKSFVKVVTTIRNTSGSPLENFNLWVGTADDFVGGSDTVTKTRGNLSGGSFTTISNTAQIANSVEVTNGSEKVYFYSSDEGVNSVIKEGCCSWTDLLNVDPTSSANPITNTSDGQYAFYFGAGDLASNTSKSLTWYWIAGETSEIATVLQDVAQDEEEAGSSSTTPVFRAPRTPSFDQFASGPAFVKPGENLILSGSRLDCTKNVQINSQSTTFTYGTSVNGAGQLSIAIPQNLKPGPYSMSMDSCDGQVTFENLLVVPKPPVVFEAVSRNALDRMLVLARLQGFTALHFREYNHAECIVNASVPSLQTAAREMFRGACRIATMFLTGSAGSTSELRNTHKPANVWLRVTLSNK